MLALIAGQGDLPRAVAKAAPEPVLVCALAHALPDRVEPDLVFRLERLGGFLRALRRRGVTRICMCGRVTRPALSLRALDLPTLRLLPRVVRALRRGDDGALRIVIGILEGAGFQVLGAHEAAPDLLPPAGILTEVNPGPEAAALALLGDRVSAAQGRADLGQAAVLRGGRVAAQEDDAGTDAMLARLAPGQGGQLYKAPKPGQDRRADLPVIGPATVAGAARAGLDGLVIEAGGVMVLDRDRVLRDLDAAGMYLWVRERGA